MTSRVTGALAGGGTLGVILGAIGTLLTLPFGGVGGPVLGAIGAAIGGTLGAVAPDTIRAA